MSEIKRTPTEGDIAVRVYSRTGSTSPDHPVGKMYLYCGLYDYSLKDNDFPYKEHARMTSSSWRYATEKERIAYHRGDRHVYDIPGSPSEDIADYRIMTYEELPKQDDIRGKPNISVDAGWNPSMSALYGKDCVELGLTCMPGTRDEGGYGHVDAAHGSWSISRDMIILKSVTKQGKDEVYRSKKKDGRPIAGRAISIRRGRGKIASGCRPTGHHARAFQSPAKIRSGKVRFTVIIAHSS